MDSLDRFRVFYEVGKAGNITKASETLFISQPAVSQTIKKLEEELSIKLFSRNKKGVTLTKLGKEIFDKVENAILSLKSIDRIVDEENELLTGKIYIGAGSNVARELLPKAIKEFLDVFPNILITHIEDVQSNMIDMLRKGEIDIVISQKKEVGDNIKFVPLKSHKYVFIKGKNLKNLRLIKLSKGSYTHQLMEDYITHEKLEKIPNIVVTGYRLAIDLVRLGVGMALVPEHLVSDLIKSGEIEVVFENYKLPDITFGYYYNSALLTPATKVFIKFLDRLA